MRSFHRSGRQVDQSMWSFKWHAVYCLEPIDSDNGFKDDLCSPPTLNIPSDLTDVFQLRWHDNLAIPTNPSNPSLGILSHNQNFKVITQPNFRICSQPDSRSSRILNASLHDFRRLNFRRRRNFRHASAFGNCPCAASLDLYAYQVSQREQKRMDFHTPWLINHIWMVVSNIFYFHPYLAKWSNLTANIF